MAVWSLLLSQYKEKFPNFAIGVHTAGVSSQQCHSGAWFQCYEEDKSDWRSSLSEDTLDHLMRISVDGPPLAQFDPTLAVQRSFSKPYG